MSKILRLALVLAAACGVFGAASHPTLAAGSIVITGAVTGTSDCGSNGVAWLPYDAQTFTVETGGAYDFMLVTPYSNWTVYMYTSYDPTERFAVQPGYTHNHFDPGAPHTFTLAPGTYIVVTIVQGIAWPTRAACIGGPHQTSSYTVDTTIPIPSGPAADFCHLADGRINDQDCAAPAAVYQTDSGLKVYAINPTTSKGTLALFIPQADIDALGVPAANTLLGAAANPFYGANIAVYRLVSDEFSLITTTADGKPYVIVWKTGASDLYHAE